MKMTRSRWRTGVQTGHCENEDAQEPAASAMISLLRQAPLSCNADIRNVLEARREGGWTSEIRVDPLLAGAVLYPALMYRSIANP